MARHPVEKTRRQYNRWVATETLEDYALRYSPSSFRKWSPLLLANTALGSISFLALEAIGAVLLLNFGYTNAVWAIALASLIILGAGLPISYYAARHNIDIDLLTRSAGFGYVGSTITSLIYASFCFIFFALEAAIMAQALKLYFDLPLYLGYILCSLVIIPIVFYGITAINRLHQWTQPVWLILMLIPFYFVLTREPRALEFLTNYPGSLSGSNTFDPYYFGIATGISFSLIAQIGEQVDYLRFMPDKHKGNRFSWWFSLLTAGPGWIVLGFLKQIGGVLLASIAVLSGLAVAQAKEPVQMYYTAYTYVFEHPGFALVVSTIFVVISQIKINVTNAYAGSLAWSNFFSRVTHSHPGRVVWLVFNIGIALLLMELGVFEALQKILGLYSNVAIAWIAAVVADLTINKPLKLSPPLVEFKRAHLYDYNPVGFVSMSVASLVSIIAFTGAFGPSAQAYSWLIALAISFMLAPLIAKLTKGKYYIARQNVHFVKSDQLCICSVCGQQYAQTDFSYCTFHDTPICSLCCTLDSSCKDQCKPHQISFYRRAISDALALISRHNVSNQTSFRVASFILLSGVMLGTVAITFWLAYSISSDILSSESAAQLSTVLYNLFFVLAVLIGTAAWWIVLVQESQALAETGLNEQNKTLEEEIAARKQAEEILRSRTSELELHNHILSQINQHIDLLVVLDDMARQIEALHPGTICSILLLDKDGEHLRHGAAPSLPDSYNHAIDGLTIGDGVGSCGTAAFRGERVVVEDVQRHPYWTSFRDLARQAGVQSCWSQPIKNKHGRVLGTFAIYHRQPVPPSENELILIERYANLLQLVIESYRAENELRISATAFESQEGILVTDTNNVILRVNRAFTDITGYTAEEVIGKSPRILQSGRQNADFYAAMWESISRTGGWEGEIWSRRKSGEVYPEHLTITEVKDQNSIVTNYVGTFIDITRSKAAEDEIQNLAFYDPLTKLPNRRLLIDRVQQALASCDRSGRPGAILFIDLDNFKTLNDTLGHDIGDLLLQQVAQRLAACVREGDTVARLGGDEFVIMLESLNEHPQEAAFQVETVGEKILAALNQPYQLANNDRHSTPSIGVTMFSDNKTSTDELMKRADIAMYQAKKAGRNAIRFFDPDMQAAVERHSTIERWMAHALPQHQFRLYYQVQVDNTDKIVGAEVLLRWQHPDRGMISPADFIPIAEETGLIVPIGLWVLETVCHQLKVWESDPGKQDLQLAVNVSVRQFQQADFVEQIVRVLHNTAINPTRLKLELTESMVLDNITETIAKMQALKTIGVKFSMDDFGTGHSSLSSLKKLPLDQLKIDQSFVRDIATDQDDAIIVQTIIAMANNLGMEVIAEGVETEEQKDFLTKRCCLHFQGYLFGRPVPVEEFEQLLKLS